MQRNASLSKTYIDVLFNLVGTYSGPGSRFRGDGNVLTARDIRVALRPDLSNLDEVVQALEKGLSPGAVLPTLPTNPPAPLSSIARGVFHPVPTSAAPPTAPSKTVPGHFAKQVSDRVMADETFLPFLCDLHQTSLRLAKTSIAQSECRRLFDRIVKHPFFKNEVALMVSSPELYPLPKKEGVRWADCYQNIMDYANYVERLGKLSEHEKSVSKTPIESRNMRFYAPYEPGVSADQAVEKTVSQVKLK